MSKVVIIWSSPNVDGLTASAKEQFIKGLVNAGAEIEEIHSFIESKGLELSGMIDGQYRKRFRLEDVYYFEALDEKVFAYTKEQVCEIKMRLYEVEKSFKNQQILPGGQFPALLVL